ncbi:hypothetical protein LOZ53_001555 [Ophidiomyces ophidiicola]|uniref:uncharacterized protein n=1 Tax=Ophidiomyces ophidiicola TaxID=1387563 RepID=UPI0020C2B658|nr:uncharacterized protein LOZ57_004821 [Ophidiomyces ophidiicola]KAI1916170.1 hypothetical protein LOZ61_001162 [Ophidiomyces ophidiicola]KAI1929471.1 hypothetical protein LOZ60_001685 [Ophidiomyces ophidiicola]KAI1944463.1 hypothetical protein LOZ57_004821 [Ophidiomyces ophidiicola]KAI1977532.1 hypothetical protein LOZ55_003469 [Ophidiomyces ophidiicola]KAI1991159.1 hypothetical protein LOZ51_004691 [Ophidiomyces ophidiicola]
MATQTTIRQYNSDIPEFRKTRILPIQSLNCPGQDSIELQKQWEAEKQRGSPEAQALLEAAESLRISEIPVAFPTETVYGLGADATRSAAVRGIYKAKKRPSDNPLIVHVSSREQLERLLRSSQTSTVNENIRCTPSLIPPIYEPLIERYWPGPLTILIPNPKHSPLAPEVTANLATFGVRIPSSPLARLLIHITDRPLAAPSANASSKPSPTTAQHVYTDLQGRIDIILDGGPCGVGVESTVVDGLSQPPAILRPGGVGIEEIRACPGWENVCIGYKDGALQANSAPRAPGMKYKHYSPKAKVILFEATKDMSSARRHALRELQSSTLPKLGIIRTKLWQRGLGIPVLRPLSTPNCTNGLGEINQKHMSNPCISLLPIERLLVSSLDSSTPPAEMFDISIGTDTRSIARSLFSALRKLDENNVSTIYVEGIPDTEGDIAAAIMNRLRKAAEDRVHTV